MCKIKHPKPNYMNNNVNGKKSQGKKNTTNVIKYRINKETKFLYCKKQNLNQQLYCIHLNVHTIVMVCGSISIIQSIHN